MEDSRAKEIIRLYDKEQSDSANFRNLWQSTAKWVSPRHDQILSISSPGVEKMGDIYDGTAIRDAQSMASALSAAFIPPNQKFFGLMPEDVNLLEIEDVARYLAMATQIAHNKMFRSNFMVQINEALLELIVFGTCNLFTEYDRRERMLNYRAWPIGGYEILENSHGNVDTVMIRWPMTARQWEQLFSELRVPREKLGPSIVKALAEEKTENDTFECIHFVGPRKNRNLRLSENYNLNMKFKSEYVNVKDRVVVNEGGYPDNPFAVCRWMKSPSEKWGRGQGTEGLCDIRYINQLKEDLIDLANKYPDPPRDVLESFEGEYDVRPGARNNTSVIPASAVCDFGAQNAFPATKEQFEFQQNQIHDQFFKNILSPLQTLTGDRRTTLEIYERIKESLRQMGVPVMRTWAELFTPTIERTVLLLIENGEIPKPPPELSGAGFGIEYMGELALALRNQQAKGFQQFAGFLMDMSQIIPEAPDYLDAKNAIPRMGRAFGVNEEDIATEEEREAKRKTREQEKQAMMAMQAGMAAAESYNKAGKKAEEGSLADKVLAGV